MEGWWRTQVDGEEKVDLSVCVWMELAFLGGFLDGWRVVVSVS